MALPPNIRVNLNMPFPALVQGSGPVVVSKSSGVWTVAISVPSLGTQAPTPTQQLTDFIIVWDNIAQTFFKMALSALPTPVRTPTSVTSSPYSVLATDTILLCNVAGALTINLQAASARGGVPLTVKDISGAAGTNNITITRAGADTIDGATTSVIAANYGAVTVTPLLTANGYFRT